MELLFLFLILFFNYVCTYDLCNARDDLCSNQLHSNTFYTCKIKSSIFDSRGCSNVVFGSNDKQKNTLGDVAMQIQHDNATSQLIINLSFSNVKWKKLFLRLSDYNNTDRYMCKMFTVEKDVILPIKSELHDSCFWNAAKKNKANSYLLEYKAENKPAYVFKKIMFDVPHAKYFGDFVPLLKRVIFYYIDFSNHYKIVLNIQALPRTYNVSYYKIVAYRQVENRITLSDTRIIPASMEKIMKFEHLTYNEEGFYYFSISIIGDKCPEDACMRTITSMVYINRKNTSLVIGIVGASFILPFLLFIFHVCTRKYKDKDGPDTTEKILILFKPSIEKHNDVIRALAKTIKNLTGIEVMLDPVNLTTVKQKDAGNWCSDNLILATHIIYIASPSNDENKCQLDYMTYNFLKAETKKAVPEKDIIILNLPYSTKDIPSILVNCLKFELMDDFQKFISFFQPVSFDFNYENNLNYMELTKKIKLAQIETEKLTTKEMPTIIITEQSENLEIEPKEIDVLL